MSKAEKKKMTASDIRTALRNKYADRRQYAIAEEVGLSTGYARRRIDMIVLDCFHSNGFRVDGIEIKISTADLRKELEDPDKHVAFFGAIDYFTIAAPKGVVDPLIEVIPKNWGILIVNDDGTTRYRRRPLALEDRKSDKPVSRAFFASITRAIQNQHPGNKELNEAYERGYKKGEEDTESRQRWLAGQTARDIEKIKAYDEMSRRFQIYGGDAGEIEEIMDEFEAFRSLNLEWVKSSIEGTIGKLNKLNALLQLQAEKEESE